MSNSELWQEWADAAGLDAEASHLDDSDEWTDHLRWWAGHRAMLSALPIGEPCPGAPDHLDCGCPY